MSARTPGRLQRGLEACHLYVGSLPGVVVALALVAVTVRVALPLYQTVATLLAAYVLLFLARAIIALRASLAQVPIELEQAAVALGRPPLARGGRDHLAAGGAGHRRRHGARRHGDHHRAHRDADAEPDRHPHARHRVLGA